MLTVATVLKSGGEYRPEHVAALRDGFRRHLSLPHRFVCLSDMNAPCETIPLEHRWKGWFSKIELFRPGLFDGPVFYADLDTVIVGPLDDLVTGHLFTVLENFWSKARIGSGLMAWSIDLSKIYDDFAVAPKRHMAECTTTEKWGDQGFIRFHTPVEPERFQTISPGKVVSFKKHVLPARRVPDRAAVVCFHGQPRPFALSARERAWMEAA